jgi:hypothetical protein
MVEPGLVLDVDDWRQPRRSWTAWGELHKRRDQLDAQLGNKRSFHGRCSLQLSPPWSTGCKTIESRP